MTKLVPFAAVRNSMSMVSGHRFAVSCRSIALSVALAETTMIVVGSAFGSLFYEKIADLNRGDTHLSVGAGLLSSLFYVSIACWQGLYRLPVLVEPSRHLRCIARVCCSVLLSLTAVLYLMKTGSDVSRGAFLGFAALMMLLCFLTRLGSSDIIGALMARGSVLGRPAVLIGEPEELARLSPTVMLRQFGLRDVGRVALDPPGSGATPDHGRLIEEAMRLARLGAAQELVVAASFDDLDDLAALDTALRVSPLPVRLVPSHVFRAIVARHGAARNVGLNLVDLQRAPLGLVERAMKRAVDIVGASFALLVLAPILLATAIAIKLDSPGPAIFKQRRNGFNRRQFTILKFRSMTACDDGPSIVQARRGDARVTRLGRVLRRTSIDELPQLMNVLRGEMSLVGPRPHALAHDDHYGTVIGDYCMRHHTKPGITGWAQVNGLRGQTERTEDMRRRIELDIWYINNWSLALDLRILARTCLEVVGHDAY